MGKFIGLYLTPAEIQGTSPETFDRTLWHVVGNDIPTIMAAVDQIRFSNGELAHALLLGIYRVGEASLVEKVKVTDTRTCGGGLPEGVAPSKFKMAREAEMFMDISLWDGEPFPPTAIVVDVPSALIGTGIPQIVRDPAADPSGFFTPSGLLTLEDVQVKMSRYKAGGVVVITNPEDSLNG